MLWRNRWKGTDSTSRTRTAWIRELPVLGNLPTACSHHDATSVQLLRSSATETSRAPGRVHTAKRMAKEEARWCGRVAVNAVSDG
jgi:hypothetical protein